MDVYAQNNRTLLARIGKKLKELRLEQDVTQAQLQQWSGVNRATISGLENGENGSLLTVIQILRALNRLEILENFFADIPVSPIRYMMLHDKTGTYSTQKRARKKTQNKQLPANIKYKTLSEW